MKKAKVIEKDSMEDREIKLLVTFVLIAFVIVGTLPYLQLHFIDPLIQYANAAEFYSKHTDHTQVHQSGTGVDCPAASSVNTVNSPLGFRFGYVADQSDANGCYFSGWIWDETSQFPTPLESILSTINLAVDWEDPDWNSANTAGAGVECGTRTVGNVDPRTNPSSVYTTMVASGIGSLIADCESDQTEDSYIKLSLLTDYTTRTNNTYYFLGGKFSNGVSTHRDVTSDYAANLANDNLYLKFAGNIPANHTSNYWQMQEHPMYSSLTYPTIIDGFFGIDGTTFTMDTGTTNAQRGQVVAFKAFNKTEFSVLPDLRVRGGIQSLSSSNDMHLHIEVRDGNFQAGQTQGLNAISSLNYKNADHDDVAYFERNQFITFQNSTEDTLYSLGVYDLEDPTFGTANNFDISFRPNWSNSTSEIVTVFVAVQDNSTSGAMIANVTSIELENELKYNFTDVTDFTFYEPNCSTNMAITSSKSTNLGTPTTSNDQNCGFDFSNGLVEVNNVTAGAITANALPTPPNVENLTATQASSVFLDWDHDLVNVTSFRIYRTSTEANDTEPYINGLPSGSATSQPCADSTPLLTPNSYCSQGQAAGGSDLAGRIISDMTWSLRKPSGNTNPTTATFKGVIFNNVIGGGSDFSTVKNSTETYVANTVLAGFSDYSFTFRPPINSTDNDDGVGLFFENWAGGGYEIEAKNNGGVSYTSKGSAVDAGTGSTTWTGYADDFRLDVNEVNQTKLFYNPFVMNTGNLTTQWFDEDVIDGESYFYRVVPLNGDVEGDTAFIANFTEPQTPTTPANVSAIADNDTVDVNWDDVYVYPPVDRYWIERNSISADNLVAYYTFEESSGSLLNKAGDAGSPISLGSAADGSVGGSITRGDGGVIGSSYLFPGLAGGQITLGSSTSQFNFLHNTTAKWSMNYWMNTTTTSSGAAIIQDNVGTTGNRGMNVAINYGVTNSSQSSFISRGVIFTSVGGVATTGFDVPNGNFHMMTFTWDQSLSIDNGKVYIDGILNNMATKSGNSPSDSNSAVAMQFGGYGGLLPYTGNLDEYSIWNDVLSSTEISALYNSGSGLSITGSGIIGNSTVSNFTDTMQARGTSYQYAVFAENTAGNGTSGFSNFILTNDKPDQVQNLSVVQEEGPLRLNLQWDSLPYNDGEGSPSTGLNLTKYDIWRNNVTTGGGYFLRASNLAFSPPLNYYNDTDVDGGNQYDYKISGCNNVDCGDNSTSFLITASSSPPHDISEVNATATENDVFLEWAYDPVLGNETTTETWKYREHDSYGSSFETCWFWTSSTSTGISFDEQQGCGQEAGAAWLFKSIPTADITGSDIILSYVKVSAFGGDLIVLDGYYNENLTTTEWPETFVSVYPTFKGGGILSQLVLGTGTQTVTLPASSINYSQSTTGNITVAVRAFDSNISSSLAEINVYSINVTNVGFYNFTDPATVENDYGTPEDLLPGCDFCSGGQRDGGAFYVPTISTTNSTVPPTDVTIERKLVPGSYSTIVPSLFSVNATAFANEEYLDETVSANTTYQYKLTPYNGNATGNPTVSNEVLTNNVPTAPYNLTGNMGLVIPYLEDVFLFWQGPLDNGTGSPGINANVTHYWIERKAGIGPFSFLTNTTNATTSWQDGTVVSSANYTYKLRAVNPVGFSPYSNTFSIITTPLMPPNAPTNLTATTVSGYQINVEWLAAIAGDPPTDYILQQRHVGFTGFVTIATIPVPTLYYNVTGLLPGNTYDYRVRADNGAGSSAYSNIDQAVTFNVPSAPQNLNAVTFNNTRIDLTWNSPLTVGNGIENYTIERESPVGGGFAFLDNTTSTSYSDLGLFQNTVYNYKVKAANDIGYGIFSNQDNDKTHGVPDAPINLSFTTDGVSSITVDWDTPVYTGGVPLTAYSIDEAQGIGGTFINAIPNHSVLPETQTFNALLQSTSYIFRIAAKNQYGTGAFSANLTAGTFPGPSEPENFLAVFNSTRPYSVNLSWSVPLDDGGETIQGYLIQRKNLQGVYVQIANVTNSTFSYIDTNLINLASHTYRIAAYGSIGDFTADQPVTTVVPANFVNFTITDFDVAGDVLRQDYVFTIDDCFPQCTFTVADLKRNGIIQSTFPYGQSVTLDTPVTFTSWLVIPNNLPNSFNTTAFVTNLGSTNNDEAGVTLATAEFLIPETIFYNHTRTANFEFINFTLIRHPVPWNATCEQNNGGGFGLDSGPVYGQAGQQPILSLQNVGFFDDQLNSVPSLNTYVACFNPPHQILAFTSFGLGNGTFALTSFTGQLGDFLGVPVPFIFIIFLAAIWTGRSASTGIIFLSVAIGAMGVLGYFPGLNDQPLIGGAFWALIVVLTTLGVLVGKRFF